MPEDRPANDRKHDSISRDKTEGKKTKGKQEKKPKVPAAFALMYGFSATNIGKNRLTVCLTSALSVIVSLPSFSVDDIRRVQ